MFKKAGILFLCMLFTQCSETIDIMDRPLHKDNESFKNEDLIKEKYIGIRPAPGYPSCPDHSEKIALFNLLDIKNNSKLQLTESYAVYPASSVSGWYFSHPESKYFGLSRIDKEQLIDYAERKKMEKEKLVKIFPQIIDL